MKNLIFKISLCLIMLGCSFHAEAQFNLKWSNGFTWSPITTSSTIYGTPSIKKAGGKTIIARNEFYEPTLDSIKGVITAIDSMGNQLWNVVLSPVSTSNFTEAGIVHFEPSDEDTDDIFIAYNSSPTQSRLININNSGSVISNVILVNIVKIIVIKQDSIGVSWPWNWVLIGKTPQVTCGMNQCNGISISTFNSNGVQQWNQTRYTSNMKVSPGDVAVDSDGNILVCGKKAASAGFSGTYDRTFLLKYSSSGAFQYSKEIIENSVDSSRQIVEVDTFWNTYVATESVSMGMVNTKLRKMDNAGNLGWTKSFNGETLNNIFVDYPDVLIATSSGMYSYNSSGTQLYNNSYHVICSDSYVVTVTNKISIIATNVDQSYPTDVLFFEMNINDGTILSKKNLSIGNHIEYANTSNQIIGLIGVNIGTPSAILLIKQTMPPYGLRLTKLASCSEFSYGFSASTTVTNTTSAGCNTGKIKVSFSGSFNSWPHIEVWGDPHIEADPTGPSPYTFENIAAGNYTVKVFDESCGEQDFNVTVKCPKPSSGFSTTNQMATSAMVHWNGVSCNNGYRLQYRKQGTSAWTTKSVSMNAMSYTITGLMPLSTYEWKIATKCTGTSPAVYSAFSNIQTFNTTSIREEESADMIPEVSDFSFYPNPVNSMLNITSDFEFEKPTVRILNTLGQIVLQIENEVLNSENPLQINVESKPAGIYFIQLYCNGIITNKKIIIQ